MEFQEQYSDEARIQLSFFSFMTIAVWICFGVGITFSFAFHLVVTSLSSDVTSESTMFWFSSLMYGFLGFIFSLIGSAIIYPVYNFWCERMRGQRVKGKIALVKRGL
jgi:H+/Cl- antiporter ClcA